MPSKIKVAEFDLSFFTSDPSRIVLTAEESEHGYDYTLTYYLDDDSDPLECAEEYWTFYDQESAYVAAYFMAAKIKEILY